LQEVIHSLDQRDRKADDRQQLHEPHRPIRNFEKTGKSELQSAPGLCSPLYYEPKSQLRDLINYPLLRTYGVWQIRKMLKSYGEV
jgi:hypothetical protein